MSIKTCEFCGEEFSDPADYGKPGYKSIVKHECPEIEGKVAMPDLKSGRGFACHCSPKGREQIRLVREWLFDALKTDRHTVDATNMVSAVVYNLEFGYSAAITGIGCDQWAGVSAETHDGKFKVWMECDDIEDGFAYVYRAFHDHFGEGYEFD